MIKIYKYALKSMDILEIIGAVLAGVTIFILFYKNLYCFDCLPQFSNRIIIDLIKYIIGLFGVIFPIKFFFQSLNIDKDKLFSVSIIGSAIFLSYFLIATDIGINQSIEAGFSIASLLLFFLIALIIFSEKDLWESFSSYNKFKIGLVMVHLLSFNFSSVFGIGMLVPVILSDLILSEKVD